MTIVDQVKSKRKPSSRFKVMSVIASRFSPRVYSQEKVSETDLRVIFEAARLAPSGRNRQPWYYFWFRKGTTAYEKVKQCIPERNSWVLSVPLIIIACYDPSEPIDGINKWAQYDLGASVISLILQAQELGYYSRQIGSFHIEKARALFNIPNPYTPFTLIAMGKQGNDKDYQQSDKEILEKELTSWERKEKIDEKITS